MTDPVLRNGRVIFTTTIPDSDVCAYGGRSWIMEMNALTGAQLSYSPFDLNGDKKFNDKDLVTVTINGTQQSVPVSAIQATDGMASRLGLVSASNTLDIGLYSTTNDNNGANSPASTPMNPGPGALGRQSWRQLR